MHLHRTPGPNGKPWRKSICTPFRIIEEAPDCITVEYGCGQGSGLWDRRDWNRALASGEIWLDYTPSIP